MIEDDYVENLTPKASEAMFRKIEEDIFVR